MYAVFLESVMKISVLLCWWLLFRVFDASYASGKQGAVKMKAVFLK